MFLESDMHLRLSVSFSAGPKEPYSIANVGCIAVRLYRVLGVAKILSRAKKESQFWEVRVKPSSKLMGSFMKVAL